MNTTVQKRNKTTEPFDIHKALRSIVSSCVSSGTTLTEAQRIAKAIGIQLNETFRARSKVTSNEIRSEVSSQLRHYNHNAADLYALHRSLS